MRIAGGLLGVAVTLWLTLWLSLWGRVGKAAEFDWGPAREHLAAGRYGQALASARHELARTDSDADSDTDSDLDKAEGWMLLGTALLETGQYREALAAFLRSPSLPPAVVGAARVESLLGERASALGRLDRLLAERAVGDGGSSPAVDLLAFGDAARMLGARDASRYRTALDFYEAAARQTPADPRVHVALGDLLLDRYNNEEALRAYEKALTLDERFGPALLGLARSRHFDNLASALEVAERCLELHPHLVAAHVFVARRHLELEAFDAAQRELERALTVNPRDPEALTLKAALHFLREERGQLDATMFEVGAHTPGYAQLYVTLAEVAAQNRRYRAAVEFAEQGASIDPDGWRALSLAGRNRLRIGDVELGRRALERAFQGDPFDVWTKNTLDLLDRLDRFDTARSEHFAVLTDPRETAILSQRVLAVAEEAYRFFVERYRHRPPTPIRIEVYPRHEDFSVRTLGLTGVDIVGVSFGPVIALDSPSAKTFGAFNWASAVWHEVAHSFHLDQSRGRVPRWFTEGLAVHEERQARPGWGADVTPSFLAAFSAGRLTPISRLNEAFLLPQYPEQIPHAYFQASLMMAFIEANQGFEAITRFLEGFGSGAPVERLLREVLGASGPALDAAFDAFVRARFSRALGSLTVDPPGEATGSTRAVRGRYPDLLEQGRAALEAGEGEAALALLRQAQALFPEHAGPGSSYRLLARALEARGAWEAAIVELQRNIDIDGDDVEGHEELARLLQGTGAPEEAAQVLERALLIDPFQPRIHIALASLYESRQAWGAAVRARRALLDLNPTDPVVARYRLAHAHLRAGEPSLARQQILAALERAPMYRDGLELLLQIREVLARSAPSSAGGRG